MERPNSSDNRYSQEFAPSGAHLSRKNSFSSAFSTQSVYGDKEPGHYVVVYDTLDKRISLESAESMKSSSNTMCAMSLTNEE